MEKELLKLGFTITDQYPHDDFITKRFQKGVIILELAFEQGEMVSCDLVAKSLDWFPVELDEIKLLDKLFNGEK